MIAKGVNTLIKNILYTERGRIVLSIILGLGFATLFRKFCEGKNCYYFIGPEQKNVTNQIYSFDSKNNTCYTMKEKNIKCGNKEQSLYFA